MTTVWIMVMLTYGSNVNTGPEFKTRGSCESAATVIAQSANERTNAITPNIRTPWCVRIEK